MPPALPLIGGRPVDPPVVLAPMAGITNRAFRRLCRESGAGIYVSEMITSRALVERNDETMDLIRFDPDEAPRSLQLYGVDPAIIAAAVRMVVTEDLADHVDLNFGCPVPKVTRKGGGSALPWKRDLFREVVAGAVAAADGRVPVTVKMRKGIDDDHLTYLEAGRAAAQEGAAWVALHGRTAEQMYGGQADWSAIARLVEELAPLGVPVLGNGDIWTADDALRMVEQTGCAGVVVGRGCLGRPWLFGQLAAAFAGGPVAAGADLRRGAGRPAPACRAAGRHARRRAQGLPRHPQAHGVVPQGVPGRPADPGRPGHGGHARRSSTTCSRASIPTSPTPASSRPVPVGGPRPASRRTAGGMAGFVRAGPSARTCRPPRSASAAGSRASRATLWRSSPLDVFLQVEAEEA